MIKRILSLLLAFLMVFSMVPAQALAAAGAETSEQKAPEEMTISACPTCGQQDCVSEHTDWCAVCMKDDCGTDHSAIIDAQPCDKCGNTECSGHENWCDLCKTDNCGKDHGETKDQTQVLSSKQVNAVSEDEPHPMEGKLVQFIKDFPTLWDRPDGTERLANKNLLPSVMRVVKVETDSKNRTLYLLEAVEGTWDSYYEGYYYANSTQMEEIVVKEPCPVCGETDCTTEHKQCGICGEYDCAQLHFFCEICQNYTCTQAHLICPACGTVDCEKTHIWCGICADYDCGMTHENEFKPNTKPVIPADPTLTPGEDVSILDEYGDAVTEDGLYLAPGMRISLSAWGDPKAAGAAYQWQIRYNETRNLWVDIQGQTGKGILISPAMFLSVIEESGSAAIRCRVTSGGETKISAAIPVTVVDQQMTASFGLRSGSVPYAEDENGNGEDLQKSYVVVQYVYADGRTAASGDFAEVIPGTAINYDYTLPTIPGYKATLENAGAHASVKDGVLTVTYAEGELAAGEYEQIKVVYQPDYVRYTIIHYWQNVGDDRHTEHEREVIDFYDSDLSDNDRAHKTGEVITNAHKSYPGFYNLLYETPAAAADGSTVIEVYYDRYYYLMKFDLGDMGYGVDPIYARTGAEIEIGTPTRAGYIFQGWKLNGVDEEVPAEMPPESRTYTARWEPKGKVEYTIVYWKENADNNNYSYWTQRKASAMPGTTVSGSDSVANYVTDEQYFTYNDHLTDKNVVVKGDGSTIVNVYYNRNYYTIAFYYNGACNIAEHTHGTDCNTELICGTNGHVHNADCDRTLTCTVQAHIHTTACAVQCGLPIHTAHTEDCLVCSKKLHPAHTMYDDCYTLDCKHTHTVDCYSTNSGNYYLRSTTKPTQLGNDLPDGVHTYVYNRNTYYYLKIGNNWYCARGRYTNSNSPTTAIIENCQHSHSINEGCYDLSCTIPIHAEHTEADGCYADVIHTQHTDDCYDHTSHSHTENCYTYECGEIPHEHDSSCYRACTKYVHTHGNSCAYGSGNNTRDYKIYRVITAKYEANIGSMWPTADDIDGFAYWTGAGNNQSSRVLTMTSTFCNANGTRLLANYNSTKYTLKYWFEHFDQDVEPDGTTYVEYNNIIYKLSEEYSQTAYYNANQDTWGYKAITGMTAAISGSAEVETGRIFNLYYKRNRVNLSFYNVNEVVKTEVGLMFGQPLANCTDNDGNLLSAFVPEFPANSYEPGSRSFAGWYTTSECLPGTEADFSELTMPNNNLTLYAKWEPVSYRVNYYLSDKSLARNENIPAEMDRLIIEGGITKPANDPYTEVFAEDIVKHGGYLENPGEPGVAEGYKEIHPFAGYEFIGWFYLDEEGTENAFDPANIPVHSDLNLYAKWSSNILCCYNVYFALDEKNNTTGAEGADGIADVDANGNVIYIADPVSGSAIAGHTHTFPAKGGEELYDPVGDVNYREGYFPTVDSHSITIDIADTDGTGANSYTFLYRPKDAVPYTVKYVVKETGESLFPDKVVSDNKNVVVTENFKYKQGYMPEKYQITLIVTDDDNKENDVIIFYYTKDEQHALYVINYYIQDLNEDLSHKGWSKYDDMQSTGTIGESYVADAITIDGFTLSKSYTDGYNRADNPINGMTGASLPSTPIEALTDGKLSGKLSDKGMELNFYYTRNLYPYEFRYMLNGTTTKLADSEFGMAGYDTYVTGVAREIVMDLDGDGIYEDYRLYDPTEVTKDIHIIKDGDPLPSDHVVTEGQATVNVATFYYVRCTQTMTITKEVVDEGLESDPNPNQEFAFSLLIHAKNGYHRTEYTYQITEGEKLVDSGTLSPVPAAPNTLQFTLKDGQKITIEGLPTAEYTVSERNLPVGYYDDQYSPAQKNKLTVNGQLDVTVRNTYDPALLSITKTVDVVEDHDNIPEIRAFAFTITVPSGVTGSYGYTIDTQTHTATVSDGSMTIELENGQTATFQNLPVGTYTVTETDYSAYGYDSSYKVNASASYTEGQTATIATVRGTTQTAEFLNKFPVGDLNIEKTVSKEFYGTVWNGDTFTFSVERTTAGRPLKDGNKYDVYEGETKVATATVEDGKLVVTMTFDAENAAAMDEASEQNVSVTRTLVIKNLPAGTYSVVEDANSAYVQTPIGLKVENLVIPAEEVTASFANTVKRGAGNLSLEKELEVLGGYQRPAEVTKFSFTVELLECVPAEEITVAVAYSPAEYSDKEAAATSVTMSGGSFTVTLEAGQAVQIQGLPEGKYRITEETIPYYANSFAHRENGSWAVQPSTTTDQGQMYTEIGVANGKTAEVKCTNIYPVDKAELIIQKVVTKEYKRDTLPDNSFTFTVTLEEDDVSSYAYKIYNADGSVAAEAAADVENRAFSIVLKAGQYAVIPGMPVCGYTLRENVDTANFNASYAVYVYETGEAASAAVDTSGVVNASGTGASVSRTFSAGKTDAVVFTNKYKRHLGTLTVNKTVIGSSEDDVFIFHIKGTDTNNSYIDMDVTIEGNSRVTVYDLPLGTYSVTEDISWSWRYTADVVTRTVNLSDDPDAEVEFTNTYRENRWLNYYTDLPNTFGKKKEENEGS